MNQKEVSVEQKVKVLKEKERELKEQQKALERVRKEVEDELSKTGIGHTGENSRSGGDDTRLDLKLYAQRDDWMNLKIKKWVSVCSEKEPGRTGRGREWNLRSDV